MIKVEIGSWDGSFIYIPLEKFLEEYRNTPPPGWYEDIEGFIKEGLTIENEEDYFKFTKKMNLRWFDYKEVRMLYRNLQKSKYSKILDDDILKWLAIMYGFGYFRGQGIMIDIHCPDLDTWLNTKNVLKGGRDKIPEGVGFSLMDLVPMKYGQNGIRWELLRFWKFL